MSGLHLQPSSTNFKNHTLTHGGQNKELERQNRKPKPRIGFCYVINKERSAKHHVLRIFLATAKIRPGDPVLDKGKSAAK
jgi:hypothetical protein